MDTLNPWAGGMTQFKYQLPGLDVHFKYVSAPNEVHEVDKSYPGISFIVGETRPILIQVRPIDDGNQRFGNVSSGEQECLKPFSRQSIQWLPVTTLCGFNGRWVWTKHGRQMKRAGSP
ncbi:hypothetical protein NQZ68_037211 [Dissostichus eleginoides]|nr:hypothetical protein NQZ68_037211 [Dissostichus eleginoides]